MTTKNTEPRDAAELRRQAEEQARSMEPASPAQTPDEIQRLLHELRVHQIELEMQNEELHRTQEALEVSRARYFDLYDLAPVGYLTLGKTGLILETNLTAATLLATTREGMTHRPFSSLVLPEDGDACYLQIKQLFKTGEARTWEIRMLRTDSPPFWAHLEATLHREPDGAPTCRCTMNDITDRKRAEQALQDSNRKLERTGRRTMELATKAEAASRAKTLFISRMSHELRTPLNAVMGFSQLLMNAPQLTPRQTEQARSIHRAGSHLLSHYNEILDMSGIEAGTIKPRQAPFDLHSLLDDLEHMFQPRAQAGGLQFLTQRQGEIPRCVDADQDRLRQVLDHLLNNAFKFTTAGRVVLGVRSEPATPPPEGNGRHLQLIFEVADSGTGIAPEDLKHIFEPFAQVETGVMAEGTGLGLAISRGLAEVMDARLTVESEVGKGSCFRLDVPVDRADGAAAQ